MNRDDAAIARIERAIPKVGADLAPPAGWEARVRAAIAPRRRRWWLVAIPAAAAIAVAIILLIALRGTDKARPTFAVTIERGGAVMRGDTAKVGDRIVAVAPASPNAALWIYRDGDLVLACPDVNCTRSGDRWTATHVFEAMGRYRVVFLTASSPIPAPTGRYDSDVGAALAAGATQKTEVMDVR
jgi:hypothetical protein